MILFSQFLSKARTVWYSAAAAVACTTALPVTAQTAHHTALVHLRPQATAVDSVVTLGDVADIEAANHDLRSRLTELDVADFAPTVDEVQVTRSQVAMRIRLGVDAAFEVSVDGPDAVRVHRARLPSLDGLVRERIALALAETWKVEPSDVAVKLLQPLPLDREAGGLAEIDIEAVVPTFVRPGTARVKVLVHRGGQLRAGWDVLVSAELFADVVIAATDISRQQVLTETELQLERQSITKPEKPVTIDQVVGKTTRRAVRAGESISMRLLSDKTPEAAAAVKPRDVVRLVARKGPLLVSISNAEVLQSGAIGDRVRVRNPRSRKVITGRVVSRTEVQVDF